ncbi:uncharacterized protein NPIL_679231 [Nephila pilipes]|uniref:Uncharacterized protein n=1 Tax=Nephila pilipes TaxID=299642 RepID=A0A8X6NMF1_NEPPI|nr:uncharacterized protein NPIL_679231 [Nephila pilipes]
MMSIRSRLSHSPSTPRQNFKQPGIKSKEDTGCEKKKIPPSFSSYFFLPPPLATCPVTYDKSVAVISSRRNATQYWPRPSPSLSTASRFSDGFNVRLLPEREKGRKREELVSPYRRRWLSSRGAQWALLEILAINLRLLTLTGSCLLTFWPRLLGREAKGVIVGAMPSIRPTTASHWPRGRVPLTFFSLFLFQSLLLSLAFSLSYPPKAVAPSFPLPKVLKFPAQEKKTVEESNTTHALPFSLVLC